MAAKHDTQRRAVMGHIDCVLPAHMLKPGPTPKIAEKQLSEQLALNWWDQLAPEVQVLIHRALRDTFVPLAEVQ